MTPTKFFIYFMAICAILAVPIFTMCPHVERRQEETPLRGVITTQHEKGGVALNIESKWNGNAGLPLGADQQVSTVKAPDTYSVIIQWLDPPEGYPETYTISGEKHYSNWRPHEGEVVKAVCKATFSETTKHGEVLKRWLKSFTCSKIELAEVKPEQEGE